VKDTSKSYLNERAKVNLPNFFAELKRRDVYKIAIAYGVVAWLLMQVGSQIFNSSKFRIGLIRPVFIGLPINSPR
jgi:hypothetical protein